MLINEFWKIPFLRFILPFILGIILASANIFNQIFLISLSVLFIGLALVYRPFLDHSSNYRQRWIFGVLISLALFFGGASFTVQYSAYNSQLAQADRIIGYLSEPIKETEKTIKLNFKVIEYQINDIWNSENSNILVYLEKDSLSKSLVYGDMLLLKSNLKAITNAGNPEEFDYKRYLAGKQIHFQTYQSTNHWMKLNQKKGNILFTIAFDVRDKILKIYQESGIRGDEFAILSALSLGVKDYLSDDIVEDYSDSGAMHVLAVSGLHVGIITMVLNFLLFPLRKKKKLIVFHSIIIILSVWFFALITGLAPSVSRAALMFSFFIMGKNSGRKPSVYNSMAASAFIILLCNPLALYNVGFQLSYLAIISILFFQPKIYSLIDVKNKWLDKIWQLATVSIAAQIGTTPISIFYFHQFPVYALLSNFVAIPAAFIIMFGTVLLLLTSIWSALAKIVAIALSYIVHLFNISISFIEDLPFSSIELISLNKTELLLLYLALSLIIIYFISKEKKLVFFILILGIAAFGIRDFRYLQSVNNKQFIVFNSNRKSVFATLSNRKMEIFADSILCSNEKSIDYLCSNLMTDRFVVQKKIFSIGNNAENRFNNLPMEIVLLDSLKVAYLYGNYARFVTDNKMKINYIVLNKNCPLNMESLRILFDFESIILDSSIPQWKREILKRDCAAAKVSYYSVSDSGAFVWSNR